MITIIAVLITIVIMLILDAICVENMYSMWQYAVYPFAKLWDVLRTFGHPIVMGWCIRHKINPFSMNVIQMCKLDEQTFEEWLKFVPEKDHKRWRSIREDVDKYE